MNTTDTELAPGAAELTKHVSIRRYGGTIRESVYRIDYLEYEPINFAGSRIERMGASARGFRLKPDGSVDREIGQVTHGETVAEAVADVAAYCGADAEWHCTKIDMEREAANREYARKKRAEAKARKEQEGGA